MTTKVSVKNYEDSKHYVYVLDTYTNVKYTIRPGAHTNFYVHRPDQLQIGEGPEVASDDEQKEGSN